MNPVRIYNNVYLNKYLIIKENNLKCGIYKWTNTSSKKFYIGSSVNLSRRLEDYLRYSFILYWSKKNNSIIYRSMLKYGYSVFVLEILEYCDSSIVLEREQYYLDTYKPEYNILKHAGSVKGLKHSKKTIDHLRKINKGKSHSESTKLKLSNNAVFKSYSVEVFNIITKDKENFISVRRASRYMGMYHGSICRSLKKKGFYENDLYRVIKMDDVL